MQAHGLAVTDNVGTCGFTQVAIKVGRKLLELAFLCPYEDIPILESECLGLSIELHTQCHVLHGDIGIAPMEENHGIDEEREEEIDEYTANHNQQALPSGFRTELPGLFWLFHLFGVETLVDHTGYLTVAAQRQPAHTVLCITILGFPFEETTIPFPDGGVEEEVELIDLHAKELGKEEVPSLME